MGFAFLILKLGALTTIRTFLSIFEQRPSADLPTYEEPNIKKKLGVCTIVTFAQEHLVNFEFPFLGYHFDFFFRFWSSVVQ